MALESLVIDLASAIDGSPVEAELWYRSVPIAVLGGRTAAELVSLGQGIQVLGFLVRVVSMEPARTRSGEAGTGRRDPPSAVVTTRASRSGSRSARAP